jgi:hypothetical protein
MADDRTWRNENIDEDPDRMSDDEDVIGREDEEDFEDVDDMDDEDGEEEGMEGE